MSRLRLKVDSSKSSQVFHCIVKEWHYLLYCKETDSVQVAAKVGEDNVCLSVPKIIFDKIFEPTATSSLGAFVKKKMAKLGYSQHDLAFQSGVTQMAISKIIRGVTRGVNSETLSKLAVGLGVTEDDLKKTME